MADAWLAGCRRRLEDLKYRATAVIDQVILWLRLPRRVATGCVRASQYVSVRDNTRIAVDIYRPARKGVPVDARFPVVWTFERYHRARMEGGRLRTRLDREPWLKLLVQHGYVVCVADLRGSGASFGSRDAVVIEHDRWDAYDITEWLADRPWSSGRVGMFGKSFMGLTQFLAASTSPPHLAAIFPEKTLFDLYTFAYSGGVFRDDYARAWGRNVNDLDREKPAAPVDDDSDGRQLAEAIAEHGRNSDVYEFFSRLPFRDSRGADGAVSPYLDLCPAQHRDAISASRIAVHQLAGWYDMWPRDALLWHANLSNPRKLLIGPWPHTHDSGWKLFPTRMRWFDHWLKGAQNGAMDGPAVQFYTVGAPRGAEWRCAEQWPLPSERPTPWYFAASGLLTEIPPVDEQAGDSYTVDYSSTSGQGTRWKNGYGCEFRYADLGANGSNGLTYTTRPLPKDIEITGHPLVSLCISATARDVDVFAYLETVRWDGHAEYVTEGVLRASHRAESPAPYDNLGLPYRRSCSAEMLELGESGVVRLVFDLHPLSRIFRRGHRIRVTVTGADADNALTPTHDRPPRVTLHRSARHPSQLVLPVIPA